MRLAPLVIVASFAGLLPVGHAAPPLTASGGPLALDVRSTPPRSKAGPAYWVGIRNQTKRAQLVCVSSIAYGWNAVEGVGGGKVSGFTHACEAAAEWYLVLKHETAFRLISVDPATAPVQGITFRATVFLREEEGGELRQSVELSGELSWR